MKLENGVEAREFNTFPSRWHWVEYDEYFRQTHSLDMSEMSCGDCKERAIDGGFVHIHDHRDGDGSILQTTYYFKCLACGLKILVGG